MNITPSIWLQLDIIKDITWALGEVVQNVVGPSLDVSE